MIFARSHSGEVLEVTYFPSKSRSKKPILAPRPFYRNQRGTQRFAEDIDFNTVSAEIVPGRDGHGLDSITRIAHEVWETKGGFELLPSSELKESKEKKSVGSSGNSAGDGLKRRRYEMRRKDTQSPNKKQKIGNASTIISAERKKQVVASFEGSEPMDAQDIVDFCQVQKLEHQNGEAPTYATITAARAWAKTTANSTPFAAPEWLQYKYPVKVKKGREEKVSVDALEPRQTTTPGLQPSMGEAQVVEAEAALEDPTWTEMLGAMKHWIPEWPEQQ
jgi:hypothetical protein